MIDQDFEAAYTKALEEGDACPRCLKKADGSPVVPMQHARTCPYRMKHGCPQCGTKEGRHAEGCTWDVTDEQQAAHERWEANGR